MAAQPKKRAFIKASGGFKAVIERIANGERLGKIAHEYGMSHNWLSTELNKPRYRGAYLAAKALRAEILAEQGLEILQNAPVERDHLRKAELLANYHRWMAGVMDRETYGDQAKVQINQQFNAGKLFIEALTWKQPSQPTLPPPQPISVEIASSSEASAPDSEQRDRFAPARHGDSE